MDHVEIDARLEKVKSTMETNRAMGHPITFEDAVIVHLWERIKDLEDEVSILMTAHENKSDREYIRERLGKMTLPELAVLFRKVTGQPEEIDAGGSES